MSGAILYAAHTPSLRGQGKLYFFRQPKQLMQCCKILSKLWLSSKEHQSLEFSISCVCKNNRKQIITSHAHTHTHTYIYIYIYLFIKPTVRIRWQQRLYFDETVEKKKLFQKCKSAPKEVRICPLPLCIQAGMNYDGCCNGFMWVTVLNIARLRNLKLCFLPMRQ